MTELWAREPYLVAWAVFALGLALMAKSRHLVKQLIGLYLVQTSVIVFFMALAVKPGAAAPILAHGALHVDPARYINPLPHVLMLTAIVVGVATQGVAFMLLRRIYQAHQSLHETDFGG
ncbi:MAG TPA: cation:proton antiporter subunit C [bacterium]